MAGCESSYHKTSNLKIHHTVRGSYKKLDGSDYLHSDESLKIIYIVRGHGHAHVVGNCYPIEEGDIIIANANEMHVLRIDEGLFHERISLYIEESVTIPFANYKVDFFGVFKNRRKGENNRIEKKLADQHGLSNLIREIFALVKSNEKEDEILAQCSVIRLLIMLKKAIPHAINNEIVHKNDQRVREILDYINNHLEEDITLDILAENFFISKHYLCHVFKSNVGMTVYEYVTLKRILLCNKLICEGMNIGEASLASGFNQYSNFYKAFRKYMGMSPSEYKQSLEN